MKRFDFDVAIIGGGSAGYAAARTTANAGLRTVVVEGGAEVGGLCILRGCMPSKALLYAAEVLHQARRADVWGLKIKLAGFDFARVMRRKARRIGEFADCRRRQLEGGKFEFIRARATFLDANTVSLENVRGGKRFKKPRKLSSKYFVVATGSVISPAPFESLNQIGYLTSDDALSLRRLPKSLVVLGGGAIACELAQFFARLDVTVTMVQRSPHVLKEFDSDSATVIEGVFRHEGIKLFTDTRLVGARRVAKGKQVEFEHRGRFRRVEAEEILLALGRSPNTTGLGLERAGVNLEGGRIAANSRMQSSVPNIYAAGDCTGPHDIVHIAVQQGETAAHNVIGNTRTMDDRLLINVVFTEPQVATVGLTEKSAATAGVPFITASYPFNDHGKSLIMEALDGFVKLLANPKTGEILGGCCTGPIGGELIHEITAAMAKRMTVRELAALPHYHPTLAEIWTYPAEELAERIEI